MLKRFILAAALTAVAGVSHAATCTLGDCVVIAGSDTDKLSDGVLINIAGIINDSGTGTFAFTGSFENDTTANGGAIATVLQFAPSSLGNILNLFFDITGPDSVAPQSFQITDGDGKSTAGSKDDVAFVIDLLAAPGETIFYSLHGTAVPEGNSKPGVNLRINAVPLPAGVLLMGTALAGLGIIRRRKNTA